MKAVIYARYSCDNQREESIEGQLRECKEFAKRKDFMLVDTYIDRAMSAKTDNRPEFQKMIKDSAKGEFDVVIVWKLDRFSRNRYDSAHYKATLRKNGVKVLSATEVISEGAEGTKKRLAELEEMRTELEVKLAKEEIQTNILTKEQLIFWLKNMEKLNLASVSNRQRIIHTFVNSIYVYDDKYVINFNCREESETIPLDIKGDVSPIDTLGEPYKLTKKDI